MVDPQFCVAGMTSRYAGPTRACGSPSAGGNPMTNLPLCHSHRDQLERHIIGPRVREVREQAAEAKQELSDHMETCDREVKLRDLDERRENLRYAQAQRAKNNARVYFMRCGEFVKIGVSTAPAYRHRQIRESGGVLMPHGLDFTKTELVTHVKGGYAHEKALHAKFSHLRHTGEWFTEAPELTEYINDLDRTTP